MKSHIHKIRLVAAVAGVSFLLTIFSAHAQTNTYIWADNAQGQLYQTCNSAPVGEPEYWPSNSSWIQSYQTNSTCNGTGVVESAPSNWDPADTNTPALGVGVYPGGPGAIGVNVILGPPANTVLHSANVTVNNLTIQTNGALSFNYGITLNRIEFQGDGVLNGGVVTIGNGGTMLKSGGTNTFSLIGEVYGGTNDLFEVDSGTLVFPSGFGAAQVNGGTFAVSNNATLLLTADSGGEPFLYGNITGVGGGTVLFTNGSLVSSGCDLNLPGNMFQWTGGSLKSGPFTNSGVFNLTNSPQFYGGATLYNNNLVNLADNSSLDFYSPSGAGPGLFNGAGATFNIEGDSSITTGSGSIYNFGLFIKSAGAGFSKITPVFNNQGGTIEVDSGTMALNVNGAGYFSNATFVVGTGATIDFITNNYNMEIEGNLTGSGGGTIFMNSGTVSSSDATTLNFPGSMFQWAGGRLGDPYVNNVTNVGTLNVSGPVGLAGNFANSGTMIQGGAGGIGGGNNLYNNTGAVYDIQNDNGISVGTIYNNGLIQKSDGTNTSTISANLINQGTNGSLEVDSGTLALSDTGGSYFTNTSLVVSNGATLDFRAVYSVNYAIEIEGNLTGSGGGTVLMTNGTVLCNQGATLSFPASMFQWQGGRIGNSATSSPLLTNAGTLNISGPVSINSHLANSGTMIQTGAGSMGSGILNNTGVYDIQNDNGVSLNNFNNYGLIQKSAGTNTSLISGNLINYGPNASLEVDSGVLALVNNGGNYFTNATLVVNTGATLDLNTVNSATEIEGNLNGSGAGTVLMTNGIVYCVQGATMNFPGSMFQWLGGRMGNSSATLTNAGILNIGGPVAMNNYGYFDNIGTMIQSGAGVVSSGVGLNNNVGGVYNIENDNGVSLNTINNYGLFEKADGTNTSVIAGTFANYGAVQAASGTLLFTGEFDQDAGTLQITPAITFGSGQRFYLNGGTVTGVGTLGYTGSYPVQLNGGVLAPGNPFGALSIPSSDTYMAGGAVLNIVLGGASQFSQLAANHYIQFGGTLNVTIVNGYAPAIGAQFQIITNGSSGNSFASVNVPRGISLSYSNSGVYLTVTSAVPAQIVSPQVSGGNIGFNFGTADGQSYTVQQNTNLSTTNWTIYTNIIGDGSLYQFTAPITDIPQQLFRVSQP